MIISTVWWYLARSSGLVSGVLIIAAFIWGILLSTPLLKPVKRPAWVLDLHRWLSTLAVVFVALHLIGLVADSYVAFDLKSIFVPFASEWKPLAVTWGIAGMYLLIAIQFSSWQRVRSRLSRKVWHGIHLLSFGLVWVVVMHSGAAGTDADNRVYVVTLVLAIFISVFVVLYRILAGSNKKQRSRAAAAKPPKSDGVRAGKR